MNCKKSCTVVAVAPDHNNINIRFIWQSLCIFIFALLLSYAPITKAAAHNVEPNKFSLDSDSTLNSVGYLVPWINRLSDEAKQAFDNNQEQLARRVWLTLAEHGNSDAAYKLGMIYDTGTGVMRDATRAVYWYQQAAVGGNIHAQHNLAVAYANGDGVDLSIGMALKWWQLAARRGNADSQYNLGIVYAMGVHGIQKNLTEAKKWWRKAAMKGDPMAQYNLGTIYANGDGQVRSYCEAMRWWEKSANGGIQQASWALEMIKTRKDYNACW